MNCHVHKSKFDIKSDPVQVYRKRDSYNMLCGATAHDDEGYTICLQYLTEVQCYGKIVRTTDDGYDVNDTAIEQANKSTS